MMAPRSLTEYAFNDKRMDRLILKIGLFSIYDVLIEINENLMRIFIKLKLHWIPLNLIFLKLYFI